MGTNKRRREANVKQTIFLVIVVLAVGWGLWSYLAHSTSQPRLVATFQKADGGETEPFELEVADTERLRRKGLMFRKPGELSASQGMLFIYPRSEQLSFWMKDTYIPLDIIFIDSSLKVVGVAANTRILSEEPIKAPAASQYVVELLAGSAAKAGIGAGAVFKPRQPLPVGKE